MEINLKSQGFFDITIYPLKILWGFYGENPCVPSQDAVIKCLESVNPSYIKLESSCITKKDVRVCMDFGGIAQGYAVNEVLKIFKSKGIISALIDVSGDIYILGQNTEKNRQWKVGIKNPGGDGMIGVLEVSNTAVVTSGDYESFFEKDGQRFSHIFNPQTGYPAQELRSVTTINADPVIADAWATACFAMGKDLALKLSAGIPGMELVLVLKNGEIVFTPSLKNRLVLLKQ
jgi:thiamine biosynthesis lipoprotein